MPTRAEAVRAWIHAPSSHDQIVRHVACGMVLNDTRVIGGVLLRQRVASCFRR
jgi:hypothetical protein